jgi:hypothetical protein
MKMEPMQTPKTRAEFERRFHLLREKLRQGKLFFAKDLTYAIEGIMKIRSLPNGRIDFLSVDESARLQANMMVQFDSEAFKAIADDQGSQDVQEHSAPEQT